MTIVFSILFLIASLFLIAVVLLQSGKSAGLSGAVGGADNFFAKGKGKSLDAKLAKITKWVALAFVVLSLVLNLI